MRFLLMLVFLLTLPSGIALAGEGTARVVFVDFDKRGVVSLSTRVVRLDADGSPAPVLDKTGPHWVQGSHRETSQDTR